MKKLLLIFTILLMAACSDKSPTNTMNESYDSANHNAFDKAESEEDDCRDGSSNHSDSWCCSNYGYQCEKSSSSMSESNACYFGTSTHTDSWCCSNYGYQCEKSSSSMSESNACYFGTSTHTDSWCCSNYGYQCASSSSSSVVVFDYLTTKKTMKFTLTYYKQTSVNWDASSNSYTDGDPRISFKLHFIQPNGSETTEETGTLLSKDDIGEWSGSVTKTFTVPALTDTIKICPSVIDEDVMFNDDKSSDYCYYKANVGRYVDDYETVEQSDYMSSNYSLKWEWYLY